MRQVMVTAIVMTNTNNPNRSAVFTPAEVPAIGEILLKNGWTGEYDESTGEFAKDRVEVTVTRGPLLKGLTRPSTRSFFLDSPPTKGRDVASYKNQATSHAL